MYFYILDENKELVEVDSSTWGHWFDNFENRRVESTYLHEYHISTVFLGINHSYYDQGEPLVYETMVFNPKGDCDESYICRYHTWNEALIGHAVACEWVKQGAHE